MYTLLFFMEAAMPGKMAIDFEYLVFEFLVSVVHTLACIYI